MSICSRGFYSLADLQYLSFHMDEYDAEVESYVLEDFVYELCILDYLIPTANVICLIAIALLDEDLIKYSDFEMIYYKTKSYIESVDVLGTKKVFNKLAAEIMWQDLDVDPFVAHH